MTRRRSLLWMRFTAGLALLCHGTLFASDTIDLSELRAHCASDAPLITLETIIRAESGGNPNAIQLDYPATILRQWRLPKGRLQFDRQPRDAAEAIAWTDYLAAQGISVDLGLMQVSTAEAKRRHIRVPDLLDPCTNVRVGWSIFRQNYTAVAPRYPDPQVALWHALSRYNTGDDNAGIRNGYLRHIMRCLLLEEQPTKQPLLSQRAEHSPATERHYMPSDRGNLQ